MNDSTLAWPYPAVATGVGSMPGIDPDEATRIIAGEFADFPHVVELPARGPGADPVGRSAALLGTVDRSFDVETTTSAWRVGHGGQAIRRRAHSWLRADLEALEEVAGAHVGPVKIQVMGPLTLAARIEDAAGESLLRDHGAVAEISGAAGSAYGELVVRMRRAFPSARVLVQVDEPDIHAVLQGRVPTSSGRLFHRHMEPVVVQGHLSTVLDGIRGAGGVPGIRCFIDRPPIDLLRAAGAAFVGVDLGRALPDEDGLPRAWEAGVGLLLGCVDVATFVRASTSDVAIGDTQISAPLRRFMADSGFVDVPNTVAVTASTGLSGVDAVVARRVIAACVRVGSIVRDEHPEVVGG